MKIATQVIVALQKLRCYNGIMTNESVRLLTNEQLLADVATVAGRERETTARLIVLLSEIDSRRLYLGEGYSSLFTFCTQRLHLSEHAAYGRIEAARAARRFAVILELLTAGSVTLATIGLLASHLTADNHVRVLAAARHRSKREVEQQVAALQPKPSVPSSVRKLPERVAVSPLVAATTDADDLERTRWPASAGARVPAPTPIVRRAPSVVAPLAPARYKVQLTISVETHDKLRRVQDLLRHALPEGDPAAIFDRALTLLLAALERRKLAQVAQPRPPTRARAGSRHVPAVVRRAVWSRDGGRCAFVGAQGRCTERGFLEFHHVIPFARGGPASAANLQLRCAAHNAYEAAIDFGTLTVKESSPAYELGPDRGPENRPVGATLLQPVHAPERQLTAFVVGHSAHVQQPIKIRRRTALRQARDGRGASRVRDDPPPQRWDEVHVRVCGTRTKERLMRGADGSRDRSSARCCWRRGCPRITPYGRARAALAVER